MANVKEAIRQYDLLRNFKVLDTPVKVSPKIAPRTAMHLAAAVEQGLSAAGPDSLVKRILGEEEVAKLREFIADLTEQAEVGEFYRNIREVPVPAQA